MTQSPSADAVPSGASAAQPTADPALDPQDRRLVYQLIALVAIPVVLALTLTGLWVSGATGSAGAYGQVGRLATLGQQVTGLAQAMEDERSGTATFISAGRPAAGLPALRRQYAITDAWAARVRRLISQLGGGYPAETRAGAAQALASIAKLPGLRRQVAQSQASALAVITGYSAATAGLFPLNDGIADLSGNSTLIISVRALGSLSRMMNDASQQQAILGVALAEGRFGPGALTALTSAQAQQAGDLAAFRDSATPNESWALNGTLAGPLPRQARAVEQRAITAGNGVLDLGPQASQQWPAGMSYAVGWMGHAQQELAAWITADAQAQQQSEMRSAILIGGAGLGALALVALGTVFAVRSMVRRRSRPESAAPEGTAAPLPDDAGAPWLHSAAAPPPHSAAAPLLSSAAGPVPGSAAAPPAKLVQMDYSTMRIWRDSDSALLLADQENPRPAEPLALVEVLGDATSEIAEHGRVILDVQEGVCVSGSAATDTVRLLAELLENATLFSPKTAPVIVSGHALYGGGSLTTITDGGTGMSEEELTLLNRQLGNPSLADMAATSHMGLFAVALLAARHGITVTLSAPPDGGTTAEVYLPDALITLDGSEPSGSAPPSGPETDAPEAIPLMLGAPVPAPAPGTADEMTEPEPVAAEPGDGTPIFESVRSGYLYAFGREPLPFSEQQDGQSPAGQPARPSAPPPAPRATAS